jgi:membrane protein required for colicin V production
MFIDILVLVAIISGVWKGYQKGLLMALFNTLSLLVGLAAAVKLSSVVGPWLAITFHIESKYLPFISFALVLLAVVILIRFLANMIQKTLEAIKIGFINRIGGVVLYLLLHLSIISVLLYYMQKMGVFTDELIAQSTTAPYILPWGPAVLDAIGAILPIFKNMFNELNGFFDEVAEEAIGTKT